MTHRYQGNMMWGGSAVAVPYKVMKDHPARFYSDWYFLEWKTKQIFCKDCYSVLRGLDVFGKPDPEVLKLNGDGANLVT